MSEENKIYCGSRLRQYCSAIVVNLSQMSLGANFSWPATAIPSIAASNSAFPAMSARQLAWITSASSLAALAVCPFIGSLIQNLGLKRSMLAFTLPLIAGWILIMFSTNFWLLLAGRIITGFCCGGMSVASPAFVAETSSAEIRGRLGYSIEIMHSLGQFYIYIMGFYFSWEWQSLACIIMPILFYLLMLYVPESPKFLISKGKIDEAQTALAWFRCATSPQNVQAEFDIMLQDHKELEADKFELKHLFEPHVWKPTVMCMVLIFLNAACGSAPILVYTVQIFENAHVESSFLATLLTGITQVLATVGAALLVDRSGRRALLISSSLGMATSLFALGGYLEWESELGLSWTFFPISMVLLHIVLFSIGVGPISWLMIGEAIPAQGKGYTSAIVTGFYRLASFAVLFVFNDMVELINQNMTFWVFATITLLGAVYVYFQVPETKQKTLVEIQEYYSTTKQNVPYSVAIP